MTLAEMLKSLPSAALPEGLSDDELLFYMVWRWICSGS